MRLTVWAQNVHMAEAHLHGFTFQRNIISPGKKVDLYAVCRKVFPLAMALLLSLAIGRLATISTFSVSLTKHGDQSDKVPGYGCPNH